LSQYFLHTTTLVASSALSTLTNCTKFGGVARPDGHSPAV